MSVTSVAGSIAGAAPSRRGAQDQVRRAGRRRRVLGARNVVRIDPGQRAGARERGGVRRVLRLAPAEPERPVVDDERVERHQRQHGDRRVHEDRAALAARTPSPIAHHRSHVFLRLHY
jgi:hypothetical protein